jgi:hypothetical protein
MQVASHVGTVAIATDEFAVVLLKFSSMKLPTRRLIVLAMAGQLANAYAGDLSPHAFATLTQVDYYRNVTQQELVSCGESVQASLKRKASWDREGNCIVIGQQLCRTDFEAALRELRKPAARAALRAYHYAFVTALNGIAPQKNEPRDGYERRQQELQHLLAHAWTRFELAE